MPTITKKEYEDYARLRRLEFDGHVLTTDGLRFILDACRGDDSEIGRHFKDLYVK